MDLLNIFRHGIDLDIYKQLLREVFKADELLDSSHIEQLPVISDDDKGYYVGSKRTSDRYNIGFFYYEIGRSNVARKKVGLRNLVHKFINSRNGQFDAALVAFKDANHWRLSFICDIKDEATAPKRFTFVFGDADNLYRTPLERFGKLQQKGVTKTTIQDAFSVEALNDQFFKDYKAHYEKFCDFLYEHANDAEYFGEEFAHWNSDEKTQKYLRDYVKNLLGRIVFLHYLQKKGWMGVPSDSVEWKGGSQNFMYELFKNSTQTQKENFLDEVLESLFFNCLNTDRSADNDIYDTKVATIGKVRVPYLNGELFEEGFLDKPKSKFSIELFENLFNLFNSYNFTIDENDPSDAEIGVDPEMLGKIFENLLEDNKDKGAYYTPKEIVNYMCKESLIAYLQSKTGKVHHDSIRTLVNTHIKDQHLEEDHNVCERLNKALRDVKVCDPAIGSGAYPMGLLNEIFACRCQLEPSDKPKDELKGEIIQNNIYGVDIERGAVDIARLRFWLALVVDAEVPTPLPNLDYKIMQGNSLLESYKGQDLTKFMENAFAQPYAIQLNKDLKKYFKETDNKEKLRLRNNIDFTISQCIFQCGIQDEIELPNTEFFLWHTYFKDVFDEGGFDIVIGNPPYIHFENMEEGLRNLYSKSKYTSFARKGDIYCLFYELGLKNCKDNGSLCYITSNKWMKGQYGDGLRKLFAANDPQILIDFEGSKIFENATVDTNILLIQKKQYSGSTKAISMGDLKVKKNPNLSLLLQNNFTLNSFTEDKWVILSIPEQKLRTKVLNTGTSLRDWGASIINGIKTGLNDAFIINEEKRGEILSSCESQEEYDRTNALIRPILRGKDIQRYKANWNGLYVIFAYNGSYKIMKEVYPALYKHLVQYEVDLKKRGQVCYTPSKKKKKTNEEVDFLGQHHWLELDNNPSYDKLQDYLEEKIVYREISSSMDAYLDKKGLFVNNKLYFIISEHPAFLAGVVNSKLFTKVILASANTTGGKGPTFLLNIRVPQYDSRWHLIEENVNSISETPELDHAIQEHNIDRLVYELYGLTNGEVKIIDPNETTIGNDDDLFQA